MALNWKADFEQSAPFAMVAELATKYSTHNERDACRYISKILSHKSATVTDIGFILTMNI